jgi:multiple sugar transport system permease protein
VVEKNVVLKKVFVYFWATVIIVFLLFPFFVMISTMLKDFDQVYTKPPFWIPKRVTLENFRVIWSKYPMAKYFINSIIIASGATLLNTALCIPAAYAVARLRFHGRKLLLYVFLVVQMFSPVIVIISLFKIMSRLHLLNTYLSLILVNSVFTLAFSIWMLNGYFQSIPKEIEEAALIDGCTRIGTIFRVMLPIAMPGVVTTVIYAFITSWNEFMFALTFIKTMDKRPLTVGLYNFVGRWMVQWQYLMAASFLSIIPVVLLFFFIEKQLVQGLAGGAVKG